jgi:hypothetical protein
MCVCDKILDVETRRINSRNKCVLVVGMLIIMVNISLIIKQERANTSNDAVKKTVYGVF